MDCIVHGVPKSWTRLRDFHFHGACHLPPQGLDHVPLQLLTSNTPGRGSGWRAEMRLSVFLESWQDGSSDSQILLGAEFMNPVVVSPLI